MMRRRQRWQRVRRAEPCRVCGKRDWCVFTADGEFAVCMRISDGAIRKTHNEGYLHRLGGLRRPVAKLPSRVPYSSRSDFASLHTYYRCSAEAEPWRLDALACELGVSVPALEGIGIGWSPRRGAFSFPMRTPDGTIVGIRLRRCDGSKYAVTGSRDGLFIPENLGQPTRIFVCEGPTDTAALLDLGLPALGRPSCVGGASHVLRWMRDFRPDQVDVVADRDAAGQRGASRLATTLAVWVPTAHVITPPAPFSDARAWVRGGCTRREIEAATEAAPRTALTVEASR